MSYRSGNRKKQPVQCIPQSSTIRPRIRERIVESTAPNFSIQYDQEQTGYLYWVSEVALETPGDIFPHSLTTPQVGVYSGGWVWKPPAAEEEA